MGATDLRLWGGTTTAAPVIKRATGHFATLNQSVLIVPDTNLPGAMGSNITDGISKIYVYISNDVNRTVYQQVPFTPPVDIATYGRSAVCSMTMRSNNDILIAWQGVDNSLNLAKGTFSGGTFTGFSNTVVVAASSNTKRFRAIDIDDCWPQKSVAIACYEAAAATGQGAYIRVYIRKDDETTWVQAYENQIFTTQFIQDGTEDISVAWNAAGVVSNVNQLAVYYTRCHTAGDLGDVVAELQVNVNTATTNSATVVGSWFTSLNQNIASSNHRGWLYSEASGVWVFATSVGSSQPFFMSCRLYHNTFTNIVQNRSNLISASGVAIRKEMFGPAAITTSYMDGNLVFAYASYGISKPYAARSIVMRYSATTSVAEAISVDIAPRILDNGYNFGDGVIGLYGGDNHGIFEGDRQYNFMALYGSAGVLTPSLFMDMFDRAAIASGWGNATSGQAWAVGVTPATDYTVNSSTQGVITLTAANTPRVIVLNGTSAADIDVMADFSTSVLMTGAFSRFSLVVRYQDANNYIYGSVEFTETQVIRVNLFKRVAGVETQLGANTTVAGQTHAINTRIRLHLSITGTTVAVRCHNPSNQIEPVVATLAVTDGTLPTTAGLVGVRAMRGTSNTNSNLNALVEHFTVLPLNTYVGNTGAYRKARAIIEDVPVAPAILSPSNSLVSSNNVTLRTQYQGLNLYSGVKAYPQFQLATDSGFTLNVKSPSDVTQLVDISSVDGKTPPMRVFSYVLTTADTLFPGRWYFRSRMVTDLGTNGPWSATTFFTVSHPPSAATLGPRQNQSILYGTGTVYFQWTYNDTDPNDSQSAYQVTVIRADTGAVVWDSGKVIAGLSTPASNTFSASLKDIPLQWSVALWDSSDTKGPSSTPVTFTLVDPPTVAVTSPTSGAVVNTARPTIAWTFTVGGVRTQRAYRVAIVDRDVQPELTIADTGWLMGANSTYTFPANVLDESDVNAFTEDFELNVSRWSMTNGTLVQSSAQAHGGTKSGLMTTTGTPTQTYARQTVANRFSVIPGRTYKLDLWVYAAVSQTNVVGAIDWSDANGNYLSTSVTPGGTLPLAAGAWESRGFSAVAPANAAYAVFGPTNGSSPATGSQVWFDDVKFDSVNYRVDVTVQDSVGLQATDNKLFSTDWISPAQATASVFSDPFKFTVNWTNATQDANFVSWRVYRRYQRPVDVALDVYNTAVLWELMYETTAAQTSYQFNDYTAPLNKAVDYCVVQVADRFGSLVESKITSWATQTQAGNRYYFVPEIPIGTIAAFEAANVTADGFTREVEQATIHVKGRGRQQQVGDDLGYTGTLTIRLRDQTTARRDREFFEFLSGDDAGNVWMRSPFGDVLYVAFGNIQVTRIAGMGTGDLVDLTVPYLEVFSNLPVTRVS